MALVITGIGGKNELSSERIGFRAEGAFDLKFFLVFATRFTNTGFYNRSNHSFWFAPQQVESGDRIVLYTKSGSDSFKENKDGSTTYFRYWGLSESIFPDEKHGVVLANINEWSLSRKI